MARRGIVLAAVASFVAAVLAAGCVMAKAAEVSLQEKLRILAASYPGSILGVAGNELSMRDGGPAITIDDGKSKSFEERLAHADIEDMLEQIYPPGPCPTRPARDFDPGRIRSQELFKRLYGGTKAEVQKRLVKIDWFGKKLWITSAQGVDKALESVRRDIAALPPKDRKPAMKSGGTFVWREIAGTNRLSLHSFGAAIDLDPAYADYWLWHKGDPGKVHPAGQISMKVVEAFERHGFIWGGRWFHFDTMHFEYRPELLAIAHAAGASACQAP